MACTDGVELLACIVVALASCLFAMFSYYPLTNVLPKTYVLHSGSGFLYLLATEAPRCRCLNSQWIMLQQHLYTPKKSNKNH